MSIITTLFNKIREEERNQRMQQIIVPVADISDFCEEKDQDSNMLHYSLTVKIKSGEVNRDLHLDLTKDAFTQLLKKFSIHRNLLTKLNSFNENSRSYFLKAFKALALKGTDSKSIVLHVDRNKLVHDITSSDIKGSKGIPNDMLFSSIESLINDNNDLEIDMYSMTPNTFRMNLHDPKNPWTINGMPNEEHTGGFTVIQDHKKGTFLFPYSNRCICTNGIIGDWNNSLKFTKEPSEIEWRKFYNYFGDLKKNNYKSPEYELRAKSAMETNASYLELVKATDLLRKASITLDLDSELFIPLRSIANDYMNIKVDLTPLTDKQLATVITPIKVYDLVQTLTDFASNRHTHKYELSADSATNLQQKAGSLLSKSSFDLNNIIIKNPYY